MKTLLLNSSYEILSFISFKTLIRLIVKDKVEIISNWPGEHINWANGGIKYPSIVKMRYYIRKNSVKMKFHRNGIFKRDHNKCQYCGIRPNINDLTMDHVMPKSRGGKSTWDNILTACLSCNNKKGDRTPEEAGLKPLSVPKAPSNYLIIEYILAKPKHPDWKLYFSDIVEYVEQHDHL